MIPNERQGTTQPNITIWETNGWPKALAYPESDVDGQKEIVSYRYDAFGYHVLEEKVSETGSMALRQVESMNSRGQVTSELLGDRVIVSSDFYDSTGQLASTCVTNNHSNGALPCDVQQLAYTYDKYGNVITRNRFDPVTTHWTSEVFTYDDLHRMLQSHREWSDSTGSTTDYSYDSLGNMVSKSDYTQFVSYGNNGKPNAIGYIKKNNGAVVSNFEYDANGNMTYGDNREIHYDVFNKPTKVRDMEVTNNVVTEFKYGSDGARYQQIQGNETVLYIGKSHERIKISNDDGTESVNTKDYIGDYLVVDKKPKGKTLGYIVKDRISSVFATVLMNERGEVEGIETQGFGPFARPRDKDWRDADDELDCTITDRGFTQHEHLEEQALIHMNGRAYDYNLGRFLSVDPIIADVGNGQALNPYSYILNNPLSGVDPTGYAAQHEAYQMGKAAGENWNVITFSSPFEVEEGTFRITIENGAITKIEKIDCPTDTIEGPEVIVAVGPGGMNTRSIDNLGSRSEGQPNPIQEGVKVALSEFADNVPMNALDGEIRQHYSHHGMKGQAIGFAVIGGIVGGAVLAGYAPAAATATLAPLAPYWNWAKQYLQSVGRHIASFSRATRGAQQAFNVTGRLQTIWQNPRLFTNWLKGSHSFSRIGNPLTHAEARQVLQNAQRLGLKLDLNVTGLRGLEQTGRWAGIPHFKIGNVHIPVLPGFTP